MEPSLKVEQNPLFPNQIDLVTEGDRVAFNIRILDGHTIEVCGYNVTKDSDKMFDSALEILPVSADRVIIRKAPYV